MSYVYDDETFEERRAFEKILDEVEQKYHSNLNNKKVDNGELSDEESENECGSIDISNIFMQDFDSENEVDDDNYFDEDLEKLILSQESDEGY